MLANFHERVEQLARTAVLTDSGDLPGLVALQEQAITLATELDESSAPAVAELARKISALAEAIVLRKVENADAAFAEIGAVIDQLQKPEASSGGTPAGGAGAGAPAVDDELITAWISGCDGMLGDLEGKLLTLEREPGDRETIGDIRRTIHTLKGECGVLSLHAAQRLCHEAETLIDVRVEHGQPVPIDPILALLDWMKMYLVRLSADHAAAPADSAAVLEQILAAQGAGDTERPATTTNETVSAVSEPAAAAPEPAATPSPAPPAATPRPSTPTGDATPVTFAPQPGTEENLADFLCEAKDHIAGSEEALLALEHDRANSELINTVFRAFHTIKGVSGFMSLTPIVSLAHSAEQLLDGARSGTLTLGRHEFDLVLASCDMMTRLMGVLEGATGPSRTDFEALVAKLDAAARPSDGTSVAKPVTNHPVPTAAQTDPTKAEPVSSARAAEAEAKPTEAPPPGEHENTASKLRKSEQTVKVNTSRMDNLVTMVGELVIAQQMVVQDVSAACNAAGAGQRVHRTLSHMGKMIRDLQEVSMSLRLVNLKSTFQKMTRLVRDVSQRAGKQIEVVTEGEDVELDRNVVEAITDPLVHMIRNSCDHGVEPADERRTAGKEPVGRISLRAYHAGGSIVIEIGDDGRGLRRDKLIAKAKSKGIIPQDADEASMPDGEVFNLIFMPGFSTAEKVTDISGRGVGMDVVRRNIEALRGKIEIRSNPGHGTTFLLRLPLTMAIIDGMVVRVGAQRYVLPTLSIQQSFRPRPESLKTAVGVGEMVMVRGMMLPIYRLNRVLNLKEGLDQIADALLIVMEADDSRFCLMVDEILGQHQVVIKTLTQTGQQIRGVSGGAILGDGRVALILEIAQIVSLAQESPGGRIPAPLAASESTALGLAA
ncbi:MAG: chemotaxis protein CheA [Phycisphaeraceae bacterium]|nr:MAG: chemotaxis protein CheA [Phycisphaeraceae bacterium]